MECSLTAGKNIMLAHITGSKQMSKDRKNDKFTTLTNLEMSLRLELIYLLNIQAGKQSVLCVHLNDCYEFTIHHACTK